MGRDKTVEAEKEKPKSYTRSYTTLGRTRLNEEKEKEKEPSPPKRISSRYGSTKDLSTEIKTRLTSTYGVPKKEEKGPPITFNTRYKVAPARGRSRDPSPATDTSNVQQTAVQRISAARNLSRDPSPSSKDLSAYSRISAVRSRDPSPVTKSYTDSSNDKSSLNKSYSNSISAPKDKNNELLKTYSGNLSSVRDKLERTYGPSLIASREKSREPSPLVSRRPSITSVTSSYPRSRDPSPLDDKYRSYRTTNDRASSRDPSPSYSLSKTKLKESSPVSVTSKYGTSSSSRLSSAASVGKYNNTSNLTQNKTPDISVSYMSASETNTRPSRVSYINRRSPQKDKLEPPSMIPLRNESPKIEVAAPAPSQTTEDSESEESSSSSEETDDSSSEEIIKPPQTKIMIQVTTITRGTSPNPPGVINSRIRRVEIAKTVEKLRQRPLQGPSTSDQSTQSDRMDDSTRNSRYGITSRSNYSPYSRSPTSYSSRCTPNLTTTRQSREPSESVSAAESDKSESSSKTSQKSDKINFSLPKSEESSVKCDSKSSSQTSSPSPSKTSSADKEKLRISMSKSKTPEVKSLPPQSPTKSDSPKVASPKVSNKDFRKSALNMGPTDRVRRSKSSSSDNTSPTVEKTRLQFQKLLNGDAKVQPSLERSSSVDSSESSEESTDVESQIEQRPADPTKAELISHKVEEAKSFLLKTLGNSAALSSLRSPSPMIEVTSDHASSETCSTNYPTQTSSIKKLDLDFSRLKKSESGEKPWWMDDNNDAQNVEQTKTDESASAEEATQIITEFSDMTLKTTQETEVSPNSTWPWLDETRLKLNEKLTKIEKVPSGDKTWWCKSPENKTSDNHAFAQHAEQTRNNMWEQETQADISEIQQDESEINQRLGQFYNSNFDVSSSQLGDRASPEGLESNFSDQKPSFDNRSGSDYRKEVLQDFNARPRCFFISKHTNIDDLLGETL